MTFFYKGMELGKITKKHMLLNFSFQMTCIYAYLLIYLKLLFWLMFIFNQTLVQILTISRENPATLWEHQGIGTLPAPRSGPAHHGHFYPWSVRPQLVKSWSSEVIWQIAMDQKHNLMVPGFSSYFQPSPSYILSSHLSPSFVPYNIKNSFIHKIKVKNIGN